LKYITGEKGKEDMDDDIRNIDLNKEHTVAKEKA
jgi:hypothetical protein